MSYRTFVFHLKLLSMVLQKQLKLAENESIILRAAPLIKILSLATTIIEI